MKSFVKENKGLIAISAGLIVAFFALAMFFPYTGDDWAWGSQLGIDRLQAGFADYNGRYLGNLMVLVLTRSKLFDAIVMSLSFYALSLATYLLTKKKSLVILIASALFLICLPKAVFVQSFVWTAGFTNYVPPILIAVYYIIIVKNIFGEDMPKYGKLTPVITFIMGAAACLFMENITIYCLALGGLVIFYSLIKFKKIFVTHCAFFGGSFVGAVIMFTNGAYLKILNNEDDYRSTADKAEELSLKDSICEHLGVIVENMFTQNIYMCILITVLTVALAFIFLRKSRKFQTLIMLNTAIHTLSFSLIMYFHNFEHWRLFLNHDGRLNKTNAFIAFVCFVFMFTALLQVLLCVKEKRERDTLLLLGISVGIIVAPLLVVNPIGPRCFFPPYFVIVVYLMYLIAYLTKELTEIDAASKLLTTALCAATAGVFIFLFTIYVPITHYDNVRLDYVRKQVDEGKTTVTMCELPYNSYVWMPNPKSDLWKTRYKNFYHIDCEDLKFEYLSYDEYEEWLETYNAE